MHLQVKVHGWTAMASSSGHCKMGAEKGRVTVWAKFWEDFISCDFSFE